MSNIKKRLLRKKELKVPGIRLLLVGVILTLFIGLVVRSLVIEQFIETKKWSEKAHNQQVIDQIISPNRGTIYDANGEILAQSIPVDTISINPALIKYSNGKSVENEKVAEGLSEIFDITYEDLLGQIEAKKSVIVVEKKVEKEKVKKLQEWMQKEKITTGINIDEDSKRYYPYESLASNLIGFCGTDNQGQTGLEQRWNKVLTGTDGKIVTVKDLKGNAISDEDEQYVASENGSNIYLTVDATIQAITEKYLKQALQENTTATAGTAIIMNPTTGDILAMATYPDFDLNNPSNYINLGYDEESWKALESADRSNILMSLWKNRAVSGTYEPGSTFKLVTASVGLEEGLVNPDTPGDFYCGGKYTVADAEIACWRSYNPHGSQTLREALCNSCNPAFMQLGQRIGATTLYKYYKAFGFLDNLGSDIAKAYSGRFYDLNKVGAVELATMSFGQRFEISPLQLISAVSTICNDGKLVKPKIIKKVENTDTNSVQYVDTQVVRQVISKTTADTVKNMMQSVVTDGTGSHAAVDGYSIGGKSGTSEPTIGRESEGYVASFVAISPIENTQVVTLVALSGLQEYANHQGGQVAGPVCQQILSEVLPYLGIASTANPNTTVDDSEDKLISVPNVKDLTVSEAIKKLQELGFNVVCNTAGDLNTTIVTDQVPKFGTALYENSVICLYTSEKDERKTVEVPNIKEMSPQQASNVLREHNLNIQIDGTKGIVVSQEPTYGTQVEEGSVINVVIKHELTDAQ